MLHSELTNLVSVFRGYFVLNLLLKDLPDIFKEQYKQQFAFFTVLHLNFKSCC